MKSAVSFCAVLFYVSMECTFALPLCTQTQNRVKNTRLWSGLQHSSSSSDKNREVISRRGWFTDVSIMSIAASTASCLIVPNAAYASGGATAGGAYLLSAKQRYNDRVTAGLKAFLKLSSSLDDGSKEAANAYFSIKDVGGWEDSSAAAYLLANAFRRSSSTPPDSLPSVKAWKAFKGEVEKFEKTLKKKDVKKSQDAYKKAEALLDAYLETVELPPVIEMRQ